MNRHTDGITDNHNKPHVLHRWWKIAEGGLWVDKTHRNTSGICPVIIFVASGSLSSTQFLFRFLCHDPSSS